MIEINLRTMTNVQLAQLITDAAAVITARALSQKTIYLEQKPPVLRVVHAPDSDAQYVVQTILAKVKNGSLVRASEKDAYAAIVESFAEWAENKKYPSSLRGSNERKFKEYGRI